MMDAFWFAPDGGYRTWRKPNWPNGPDRWIQTCQENHILPGMWFGTNALVKINPVDAWKDSLTANHGAMSLSAGGFLPDLMNVLQYWYDRGIRMFEFDFAYFDAATPEQEKSLTPAQILQQNESAFREALKKFRCEEPGYRSGRLQRIRRRPRIDGRAVSVPRSRRSSVARGLQFNLCG